VKSLRTRLVLAYAGLVLVGFTLLALLAGRQISAGTVQDFSSGLAEQAQLVARALKETVEQSSEFGSDQTALDTVLQAFAEQIGAEIILVDRDGRYWAGAGGSASETNTPEITAALSGNTGSAVRGDMAYAAAPVIDDGLIMAVVQLAAPLSAAQSLIWERWAALGGAVLGVTILAGLVALLLSFTLTQPLAQLKEAAMQIAQGDFSQRLPESRQDEIGEVAHAFNFMTGQVEAMIEEQRAFASNASHELRTPLTTIRLRSEALRNDNLDAELARQYVIELDDEVKRLGETVQDLMMLSRLDSGRLEAGRERIDTVRLARQLLAEITPQAESRAITLQLEAPAAAPVTAGSSHLMIVFRNLLNNALKYTPDGGSIAWQIQESAETVRHVIEDTGQGIAADDLAHVFDRFYRADKSRSRAVPGTGLGLPLVRTIVEFYGGTVELTSEGIGQGTTATVVWPHG
jgi:signal transduction histidine kinase